MADGNTFNSNVLRFVQVSNSSFDNPSRALSQQPTGLARFLAVQLVGGFRLRDAYR